MQGSLDEARRNTYLRTSNYDISNTCNLRCEGCLYFSGAGEEISQAESDIAVWQDFFAAEARRGVNFAYIGGAEPSLTQDRIRACHDHIPLGVIFTNGTSRIDPDIGYRIHISLWGNDQRTGLDRGANVNRKAMRNYAGDRRAVCVMTLNALNLDEIPEVAQACADHGLPLIFSLFSPTVEYNRRIEGAPGMASDYFRFSGGQSDMRLDDGALARAREAMFAAADAFPGTVRIVPSFVDWVTQPGSLYALNNDGVATDCGNRLSHRHVHFNADLTRNTGKCCSPNIDCRDCRAYAMSYATYFSRRRRLEIDWEEVLTFWREMFC